MFDKLIESDTEGAEFQNRSRYFTVSTIVVGTLFLTAVVYSLYAAEVGLGAVNFDVSELVAPLETSEPEKAPKPDQTQSQASQDDASQTSRQQIIPPTDLSTLEPKGVSVVKSPYRTLDPNKFKDVVKGPDKDAGSPAGAGREKTSGTMGEVVPNDIDEKEVAKTAPPPVVVKPRPTTIRTSIVLNGSALYLPKPAYPRTAGAINLEGIVRIQVTIDENGNVISAKAADGHPFFRAVSEQAARGAKFKPTLLNDAPVKVTGVITYNFKRPN